METRFVLSITVVAAILIWCDATLSAAADDGALSPSLVANATDGQRRVVFVAATPNFNLKPHQSIHPQLRPDFKAEWSGFLTIVRGGKYKIDGDARVFLDGREVQGQFIQLSPDEHSCRVEYERKLGAPARLQLLWQSDFFKQEPIPGSAFRHRGEPVEVAASAKIARGRELIEELNCAACHKTDSSLLGSRSGPDLSAIGSRVKARWIFEWLENPKHVRRSAVMPALLENVQYRADVAAYLELSQARGCPRQT